VVAGVTLRFVFMGVVCFVGSLFCLVGDFGIAVLAPRASYSFATAQKSNQKRPPRHCLNGLLRWKEEKKHKKQKQLLLLAVGLTVTVVCVVCFFRFCF
jgi:hypothetical protein